MTRFLAELRRRNVFRVAAAYLVVSWLLIQIAALLEASLGLPAWFDAVVIGFLALCFPVAVLLAWAFEMTPEGMKLTAAVPEATSIAPTTGRKLDLAIVAALALMIAFIAWQQLAPRDAASGAPAVVAATSDDAAPSVAVLPFVDLSEAGDQEFFSDGISEEILNVLVRLPGLSVAGRTSSFAFKGRNEDLREIGEALGVNHVLEGSVRRSGARLRITAQLIRSSDGFHMWSETYDREQADIFDIQDEIAAAVAEALAISLGLDRETLVRNRTADIEAYENYLEAQQLFFARGGANLTRAALLLTEAVARDPDFAPAWTTLAGIYSVFEYYQPSEARSDYPLWRSAGTAAARRAITLDPESAAAFAYLGQLQAYGGAWVEAFTSLDRAVELAPNDPAVLDAVAQIYNEAGYLIEGERLARRAVSLEPRVAVYRNTLGWAQLDSPAGVLDEALASLQSSLDLDPTLRGPYLQSLRGLVGAGRIAEARLLLERAIEHQAFDAPTAANYQRLFAAWASGEAQLRQEAPGLLGRVEGLAGIILGDPDIFFTGMRQQWDIQPRSNVLLYWPFPGNYRNDPRWRAYVRELGLLPLWQVRGFPAGCRALESDDFECTGVDDE